MKMMSQLFACDMWPFEVIGVTVVIEEYQAIGVAIVFCVLWSFEISLMKIMGYGPSGDMENCGRGKKKNWLVLMKKKSCRGLPPSQALRHSKLMRPDKHC